MIRLTMYKYILILMLVVCSTDFDEKYEIDENYILTSNNITADQYNKLKEKQIGIRINE